MERVQLMSENSTSHKSNDGSNPLKGILLLTLGVVLGISASAAVYKIQVFSAQPEDLPHLPRNRAIRNLNSSETDEMLPLLQICRSQLASTIMKLKEEKDGSLKACEASKASLKEEQEAMTSKLQKEKNACETVKGTLKTCEANSLKLKEENEREKISVETKCGGPSWTYFKSSNSCYYYQGVTYNDKGDLNIFLWSTAEEHCARRNAHLVSIHSDIELAFVKKMIYSNFKGANPEATDTNACWNTNIYAWIGLLIVDGVEKWSDGTAYDYYVGSTETGYRSYMMCHDVSTPSTPYSYFYSTVATEVQARFVCKKPAIA